MTNHDLKVGVVVDLNVCGRIGSGGLEVYGCTCGDIVEKAVFIPRCLPLGGTVSKRNR